MKAIWNQHVLAESDETVVVDNNHYFPADSLDRACFKGSATTSLCGWKGKASYYTLEVEGERNEDAAWYYPEPLEAAENIRGMVAFWKGVQIVK